MDISNANAKQAFSGTLQQKSDEVPLRNTPNSIIGQVNWNRVSNPAAYPYRAIGLLKATFPDKSSVFTTAFMIDEDRAATAAHCVYNSRRGGLAKSIVFSWIYTG